MLADAADIAAALEESLRKGSSVQHFLATLKPSNVYYMKLETRLFSVDEKLRRKLPLPEFLDCSALSSDFIDLEMLREAFDFGEMHITSDFGDAAEGETCDGERRSQSASGASQDASGRLFFQVTHKFPKAILGSYDEHLLSQTDIIISVLRTQEVDPATRTIIVSDHQKLGTGMVLTLADIREGMHSLRICLPTKEPLYTTQRPVSGCSRTSVSQALCALYAANALEASVEGSSFTIDNHADERRTALMALMGEGYVKRTANTPDSSSWLVTEAGQELIERSVELRPGPLVAQARPGIAISEMTQFELLHELGQRGWAAKVWFRSKEHRGGDDKEPPPCACCKGWAQALVGPRRQAGVGQQLPARAVEARGGEAQGGLPLQKTCIL